MSERPSVVRRSVVELGPVAFDLDRSPDCVSRLAVDASAGGSATDEQDLPTARVAE